MFNRNINGRYRLALLFVMINVAVLLAESADRSLSAATEEKVVAKSARLADVVYGRKHGVALTMDVIIPPRQNGAAIIWVVSGGFQSHYSWCEGDQFIEKMKIPLERGYTVFAVVHGCVPRYTIPDYYSNVRRAIRFIRHNAASYKIDPQRIGMSGLSAGGAISLMMGATGAAGDPKAPDPVELESTRLQAIGCFFPASNLYRFNDSAYTGEDQEKIYKKKEVISKVHEKGYRNKPLPETQKASNKEKSSIRVRVEHVFGFVESSMHGSIIRTIGIDRANAKIGMMNLSIYLGRNWYQKK